MKEYQITIDDIHTTITCRDNENILQAMSRQGLRNIIYGCYGGGCGKCLIHILKGEYHIHQKMSRAHISIEEEDTGRVLACCVQPTSDITIRII
ncbi:MAG: 2Fe-2S iron-sulfur cluster-binding protein [Coprobacillaceae bacterium]